MISSAIQNIFTRAYTIIKLNLFFWILSFYGGIVLGVGPSIIAISDLYKENMFEYGNITLKSAIASFKHNFRRGNILFYEFFLLNSGLFYSLYLSVQFKAIIFFICDFVIIAAIIVINCLYWYMIDAYSSFDINEKDAFKLAVAHFFYNFFDNWKLILGILVILGITYKFKGLILFATLSSMIIFNDFVSRNWDKKVSAKNNESTN